MLLSKTILTVYLAFFSLEFLFERVLTLLNIGNVNKNRKIPPFFKGHIDGKRYRKSQEYTITTNKFSIIDSLVSAAVLLFIILSGFFGYIDRQIAGFGLTGYTHSIVYLILVSLMFKLLSLPFSLYSSFVIEEKFGFNKMTLKTFFLDLLKSLMLSLLFSVPLLLGFFWFIDNTGELWWLFAFVFIITFQLFLTIIYPVFIAPVFNKFKALKDGELKEVLDSLARKLSFKIKDILVMDGSRRSRHGNAYFTGIGKTKRIVLFDTIIESLSPNQLAAVLAHEIGHQKRRHIIKRFIVSFVMLFVSFFVLGLILRFDPLYRAFGFSGFSYHGILIISGLCSGPFTFFFNPLFTSWSRRHEYEADSFVVKNTSLSKDLKEGLIVLGMDNLTNLTPHPLYSFYHYSHPALYERIKAIERQEAICGKK